jgi:hypothetical protein
LAFWKAVVPPVTRSALQAIWPFAGVEQAGLHVTLEEVEAVVEVALAAGAAFAGPAAPKPARTRAAVPAAAAPIRRHLPRMAGLAGSWGFEVRNGQPPESV